MGRTAAALVIGNEILTGKVQEANVAALAVELFGLGIALQRVLVCPDDPETLAHHKEASRGGGKKLLKQVDYDPTSEAVKDDAEVQKRRATLAAEVASHLRGAPPPTDLVGMAYAVSGKVRGVRTFMSHRIFRWYVEVLANTAALEAITAPSGIAPLVICLAVFMMSGATPKYSAPVHLPIRPYAVITSS